MEKREHEFCLRCGRRLKNSLARELGYGVVCYKKQKVESSHRLFEAKVKEDRFSQEAEKIRSHFNTLK